MIGGVGVVPIATQGSKAQHRHMHVCAKVVPIYANGVCLELRVVPHISHPTRLAGIYKYMRPYYCPLPANYIEHDYAKKKRGQKIAMDQSVRLRWHQSKTSLDSSLRNFEN